MTITSLRLDLGHEPRSDAAKTLAALLASRAQMASRADAIDSETDEQRVERCDHDGTTQPLNGLASISNCTACGKTWPSRFGAGAATVRIVSKRDERGG